MNKKILTAILISIALPGSMLSAPADSLRLKSYKLDEVVVTGTRNETDIRHLPMTISVVSRQQLEQTYQPSILPTLTEHPHKHRKAEFYPLSLIFYVFVFILHSLPEAACAPSALQTRNRSPA